MVEDDHDVREVLSGMLTASGFSVEAYESPTQLLEVYDPTKPGCLVLDLCLPQMSGLQLHRETQERGGTHPFVIITANADASLVFESGRAGAVGLLQKPFSPKELTSMVRRAIQQDNAMRRRRRESIRIHKRIATLTPRERVVMDWLLKGRLSKQIAAELGISTKTIDVHRSHVLKKMHVASVYELMQLLHELDKTVQDE